MPTRSCSSALASIASLILSGGYFVSQAHATCSLTNVFAALSQAARERSENLKQLDLEIQSAAKVIHAMKIDKNSVLDFVQAHEGGAFASGAVDIQTPDGVRFLKIYEDSALKEMAPSLVIQNAMARAGIAPAIVGYLPPKEVRAILRAHPEIKVSLEGRPSGFGVLMESLEIIEEVGRTTKDRIPKGWTPERLEARVSEIEKQMQNLRIIPPQDLQAAFLKDGRLMLYDFDVYLHVTGDGYVVNHEFGGGLVQLGRYLASEEYQDIIRISRSAPRDRLVIDPDGKFRVRLSRFRSNLGLSP